MSHVELRRHLFPNAPNSDDAQKWEVLVVTDAGTFSNLVHDTTAMRNYYPLTMLEVIEREAREHAQGLAHKLGLTVVDATTQHPTGEHDGKQQ